MIPRHLHGTDDVVVRFFIFRQGSCRSRQDRVGRGDAFLMDILPAFRGRGLPFLAGGERGGIRIGSFFRKSGKT